ncbi:phage portal protein [Caulobacter sp. DWR3-1-2]|uniref:phage portal protein n=1 Tax=Caulobacter sp. DWR3-1-2 TaxID=2804647 RepID=UPI003CF79BDB
MAVSGYHPLVLSAPEPGAANAVRASGGGTVGWAGMTLDDPRLIAFMREGGLTSSGVAVNTRTALRNPTMFRAVSLISNSIGMLPFQLIREADKAKATDHPLYRVLHREPNNWQTAFDFRSHMQLMALLHKNAYALIIRSRDVRLRKDVIKRLVPLNPLWMTVTQNDDWSLRYHYQPPKGGGVIYAPEEIFHLRGLSLDGINGISLVEQAAEAIGTALAAERALGRLYQNGAFVGNILRHPGSISAPAYDRLKGSLAEKEGVDNAGKNLILEEGMEFLSGGSSARDSQHIENRKMQVEEIARVTGVPRPLLMVDETSWGSGIDVLGQFFVRYALGPWFEAWQQAAERSLLVDGEKDELAVKFNPAALLRGSMKDQSEFFSKALGAGGGRAWMQQNEVRDLSDLTADDNPMSNELGMGIAAKPASDGGPIDPAKP